MKARMTALAMVAIALCSCGASPSEASSDYSLGPLATDRAYTNGPNGKALELFAMGEHLCENVSVGMDNYDVAFSYQANEDGTRNWRDSYLFTDRDSLLESLTDDAEGDGVNEFRPFLAERYSKNFFVDYVLAVSQTGTDSVYPEDYVIEGNKINLHLSRTASSGWFMPQSGAVFYPIPRAKLDLNTDYELVQLIHYFF